MNPELLPVELVKIEDLTPYRKNARRGDVAIIVESLEYLSQYRPIVVNRGTRTGRPMEILAGNHTWIAACELGWETINATLVDVDDEHARKINLVDNRAADKGDYDEKLLIELLQEADDLVATGFTDAELEAMIGKLDPPGEPDAGEQMGDAEFRVIVDCDSEEHQARLIGQLEAEGLSCRPLMS